MIKKMKDKKVQVAYCKCTKGIVFVSVIPVDKSSSRILKNFFDKGHLVALMDLTEFQKIGLYSCGCTN